MIIHRKVHFLLIIVIINLLSPSIGDWQFTRNGFNEILLSNLTNCRGWQSSAAYIRQMNIERKSKEIYTLNGEVILRENIPTNGALGIPIFIFAKSQTKHTELNKYIYSFFGCPFM